MGERLQEAALNALKRSERRGDVEVMKTLIDSIGNDIADEGTLEEVRELARILMRLIDAIEHEVVAGKGALMNWDDPANVEMLKKGLLKNRFAAQSRGFGVLSGEASYSVASVPASSSAASRA
ncbi:hypothetical protein QA646_05730 [Rhizobium sp. CB3090]|uniref:hypothetical protein n=1 Tax=Rhizobium sp. CB3090 TaxID=3039156 RepID=UPI0024B18D59|nr:hypothetical protein [Rhizobium sp. CB3090]WFU10358.1 hypothetical protein QA646_05730 [Rhizobium sp. CB3090]